MTREHYHQQQIREALAMRMKKNSHYSLRSFARSIGIDAAALSRILTGKKRLTPALAEKLIQGLALSPEKARKFRLSMAHAYAEGGTVRQPSAVREILKTGQRVIAEQDLDLETFRTISDWYHFAILQLAEFPASRADARWISHELGISVLEAKLALERLKRLGLLTELDGRLQRTTVRLTTGDRARTSTAHKKRIRQVSEKSVRSLLEDPIEERSHTTMTVGIDPDQLPLAKEMIDRFMDELGEKLSATRTRVYELQINLFPLQRKQTERKSR